MTRRLRTFAAVASTGLAMMQAQDAAAQRPDTVQLRFGWAAGSARVESTRFQERIAESTDTTAGSAAYRMNVAADGDGLLISYVDFVFPPPADSSEAATMNALAERAAAIVPRFIVDSAGAFVRIHDVASVRLQFDSLITRMLAPDEAAAARGMLETVLSEDALSGLAAQEWNAIVGMWADADLVIGETYQLEEQADLPMIPGATVTMISEFGVVQRTSCDGNGTAADCVEIRLISRPDPEAMKEILAQFMQGLLNAPGLGGIAFERLDMTNELVLITEPGTLRPHRARISKTVTGVVAAAGERGEVTQTEVRTFRYTWGDGRSH